MTFFNSEPININFDSGRDRFKYPSYFISNVSGIFRMKDWFFKLLRFSLISQIYVHNELFKTFSWLVVFCK